MQGIGCLKGKGSDVDEEMERQGRRRGKRESHMSSPRFKAMY